MRGVIDLLYVGLAVPDLEGERKFFTETWGLVEAGAQDGSLYFAAVGSTAPYVIRLRQADERKTELISFAVERREDVNEVFARAEAKGAKVISAPGTANGPAGGYAARFFDIDGRALEVVGGFEKRTARQLNKGEAIPARISHIVLHSPNHKELCRFYEEVLGFRVSDWLAEFMVFLRCNSAHHRLAIMPGPPMLNHIAFDVASIDELMRGLSRLTAEGVPLMWGPGRHTAGNNTFTYYQTPNGNTVEYTSDLEDVDEATWKPTVYEMRPDITDNWGTGRLIPAGPAHPDMKPDASLWKIPA